MNLKRTRLHILHEPKDLSKEAKTGVSLHCHTENSKEMLDFVPSYAEKIPIVAYFWHRERRSHIVRRGKDIEFAGSYWSPPLSANEVFDSEKKQMNEAGLDAITSITDHDCIDSNLQINEHTPNAQAPISMEWTVPFECGFFHVGVHNLPPNRAVELTKTLLDFTFNKANHRTEKLDEVFALLDSLPEVLIILNHPLWDIEMVGKEKHAHLLKNFLKDHGRWMHALEINGFRKWSENKSVIELAEALDLPIVTGGDRHGCQPNTVINLTNGRTFAEFVEEIRVDRRSEVALMAEYKEPLHSRQLQSFSEILGDYPEFPEGRRLWIDRVFYDYNGDGLEKLSVHEDWRNGGPKWLQWATWTLGISGSKRLRPLFRRVMKAHDRVPKDISQTKFEIPELPENQFDLSVEQAEAI